MNSLGEVLRRFRGKLFNATSSRRRRSVVEPGPGRAKCMYLDKERNGGSETDGTVTIPWNDGDSTVPKQVLSGMQMCTRLT